MSPTPVVATLSPVAQLMARLCEIPSPSRDEGAVADAVRAELADLGAEVSEDDAAAVLGAGCGTIVARFAPTNGGGGTPIALASHLDTVPVTAPIEVELVEGGRLTNRHPAILGADNKAAVAVMVQAAREITARGLPHAGIELVFTPCEEIGLRGANHFDPARLVAAMAFVYDHTGPVGRVVTSAPSLYRIEATFVGRAAHAGIHPEDGRSAIRAAAAAIGRMALGRIDPETTTNVGTIAGGTAMNVVPERCTVLAEARGRDEQVLGEQLTAMLDALAWAATEHGLDLETQVEHEFVAYRLDEDAPQVVLARQALEACGVAPQVVASGGGSDVNAFLRNGLAAVNLCNGMADVHTSAESIAVADLDAMLEVTLALVEAASR